MKIAVTGASGRIGNVVVRKLLEAGHVVRVLQRSESRALAALPLERVSGDLFNTDALTHLARGCEVLIHLAAEISVQGGKKGLVHHTNMNGTQNVLEAALQQGLRRVVCFSSIHAFCQQPQEAELNETRPLAFHSEMAYDRSKAAALQYAQLFAQNHLIEVVALCPTSVLGPFDFGPSLSGQMLIDFYRQKIPLMVPGGFDWCDVRDIADATVAALHQGQNGEAYLLSGQYVTMVQLSEMVGKIIHKPTPKLVTPAWVLQLGVPFVSLWAKMSGTQPLYTREALNTLRDGAFHISHAKARQILGYAPRPLEVTIADAYQWFEQNNCL